MELAGWTNDRLVEERLRRLPEDEWVYGRPNASVVMATFLHVPPAGLRFNGPHLGAWTAAAALRTAAFEVAHHLRREAMAIGAAALVRDYRTYTAELAGSYLDIRGQQAQRADVYDPSSYAASQAFGKGIRASGGAGIVYESVRHPEASTLLPTGRGTSSRSPRPITGASRSRPHPPGSGWQN